MTRVTCEAFPRGAATVGASQRVRVRAMAGRHRRPPAWRRLLTSMVRSRDQAAHRCAAGGGGGAAGHGRRAARRARPAAVRRGRRPPRPRGRRAGAPSRPRSAGSRCRCRWSSWPSATPTAVATGPDVAAALASPDRGEDTVRDRAGRCEPSPPPADRLAWSVLANLPERRLLDPRADRDQEPVDPPASRGPRRGDPRPPTTAAPPDATRASPTTSADGVALVRRAVADDAHLSTSPTTGYLSMSPTTKNIEPRIATMSATSEPGSSSASTWTLLNDAERSFSRHGVFSPRDTR